MKLGRKNNIRFYRDFKTGSGSEANRKRNHKQFSNILIQQYKGTYQIKITLHFDTYKYIVQYVNHVCHDGFYLTLRLRGGGKFVSHCSDRGR